MLLKNSKQQTEVYNCIRLVVIAGILTRQMES
jgi:hypothetical protein